MSERKDASIEDIPASKWHKDSFWAQNLIWFLFGLFMASTNEGNGLIAGTAYMSLVFVWKVLHIFLHELGHFAAAKSVGIPVSRVTVGRGPKLLSFRFANARFEFFKFLTCGGITFMEPVKAGGYFRRLFVAIAAGPAVDVLLLVPLVGYYVVTAGDHSFLPPSYRLLPFAFILVQLSSLAMGLGPWESSRTVETADGLTTSSDGHQLLAILFGKEYRNKIRRGFADSRRTLEGYGTGEKIPELPFSRRPELARAYANANRYLTTEEPDLALSAFESLLKRDDLLEAERVLIYDHLASLPTLSVNAWTYRKRALQEWLPEAVKRCSGEVETLTVTRGILLILNHELDEGEEILASLHDSAVLEHDRFGCKLYLGVSTAWRGDLTKSTQWIHEAEEIEGHQPSIATAKKYIADKTYHPQQSKYVKSPAGEKNKVWKVDLRKD